MARREDIWEISKESLIIVSAFAAIACPPLALAGAILTLLPLAERIFSKDVNEKAARQFQAAVEAAAAATRKQCRYDTQKKIAGFLEPNLSFLVNEKLSKQAMQKKLTAAMACVVRDEGLYAMQQDIDNIANLFYENLRYELRDNRQDGLNLFVTQQLSGQADAISIVQAQIAKLMKMLEELSRKRKWPFSIAKQNKTMRAQFFIGRDDIKKTIMQKIESGERCALVSGMGGIGKTQLALAIYQSYWEKFYESDVKALPLGKAHPDTATTYEKALEVFEQVVGANHPSTKTVRRNMQYLQKNIKK